MTEPMIQIEGLGKKYLLRHQATGGRKYSALRDTISDGFRSFGRLLRGQRPQASQSTEEFWALQDVSFDVGEGEVVGIIGRNGAGKSTLLKILSRITEPTTGRVVLNGRVSSLLEVGTGFHPELTGRENVYLNGSILGMSSGEIARKFDEIVAFAEVEQFLDTPVKRYSSGMYVRLAFAVAAHLEPEILIVDEVLAVGDAQFQKKCLGKMGEVAKGGRTVLFVSHNMAAVQALCKRAVWLRSGKVIGDGSVVDVISQYLMHRNQNDAGSVVRDRDLGGGIMLRRFDISPREPRSGEGLTIEMCLSADSPKSLQHLCIILYSSMDARVGIFDLRPRDGQDQLLIEKSLDVQCQIRELPLVEGEYQLGLYLVSSDYGVNITDLLPLTVAHAATEEAFVPYPAQYRGVVEFDYSIQYQSESRIRSEAAV